MKEANAGSVIVTSPLTVDMLYQPPFTRAAKLAETLPFVADVVTLSQYRQLTETSPFTVVMLATVALRPVTRTPPFSVVASTELKRIVDGTNTSTFTV